MERPVSILNACMEEKCWIDGGLGESRMQGWWSHTWSLMCVGQVVSRQVHWGVLDLVDELRLIQGIISMLNWVSRVNHIDLRMRTHTDSIRETILFQFSWSWCLFTDIIVGHGHSVENKLHQHDYFFHNLNSLKKQFCEECVWLALPRLWSHCWCTGHWVLSRPAWISYQTEPLCASSCNGWGAGPARSWPWCLHLNADKNKSARKLDLIGRNSNFKKVKE